MGVMYLGRLFEVGPVASVIGAPLHPYTQMLISAVPLAPTREARARIPYPDEGRAAVAGDDLPTGCYYASAVCPRHGRLRARPSPQWREVAPGRIVSRVISIRDSRAIAMAIIAREWAAFCFKTGDATKLPTETEARAPLCLADHLHAAMHGAGSGMQVSCCVAILAGRGAHTVQ